ncbi:nucleoside hydrolase [Occallatibacter riparius]|uniref:Nucleoside hydrolase n=1 Tax=Occallatibacter riparius TaxID=1002689 RepID=A0A9J7BUK1_9BACT|nr:nucleoside hydrolase [Occallatibacter riparius]UWZ86257.1 nucleoside hydrolase [Occallatibacter riparius]
MTKVQSFAVVCALLCSLAGVRPSASQTASSAGSQQLAILDTDIGDDIDDAFALALVLHSPEIKLLGIETAFGDTELRARLVDRYLKAVGRTDIPVLAGKATPHNNVFTQAAYAEREPAHKHKDGVQFLLDQVKAHPGQVTLIAIGPLVNVGEAIRRDPATFKKLKRVVMMGGSVYRGYGNGRPPEPEWNIKLDPEGAKLLFGAGVPITMMPLDSTQIPLDQAERDRLFSFGSPLTDQLTLLYHQWATLTKTATPTLFDPVAAAYTIRPELCPAKPLRIEVDDKGMTKPIDGQPNANVCVESDAKGFVDFLVGRITAAK